MKLPIFFCFLLATWPVAFAADAPPCVPPPAGLVAWFPGEGNANDVLGVNNGTLQGGATFAKGEVGQAFSLNGGGAYVLIPASASLSPTSLTIEGWFNFASSSGVQVLVSKTLGLANLDSHVIYYDNGRLIAGIGTSSGGETVGVINFVPSLGTWYHIALTFNGASRSGVLYVNGVGLASGQTTGSITYDGNPILLGADIENGVVSQFFSGLIDEASLYNRALSGAEIRAIYAADGSGKCSVDLSPVADDQTVTTDQDKPVDITLTATDADGDPLTFQIVSPPAHGTLSGNPPNVTYTPNSEYTGSDSFTFKANDGQEDSNAAMVNIQVVPSSDIVAERLDVDFAQDTVSFDYKVTANDLSSDPRVALYWSSGPDLDSSAVQAFAHTFTQAADRTVGIHSSTFPYSQLILTPPPLNTTHLLLVVDPDDTIPLHLDDPSNNIKPFDLGCSIITAENLVRYLRLHRRGGNHAPDFEDRPLGPDGKPVRNIGPRDLASPLNPDTVLRMNQLIAVSAAHHLDPRFIFALAGEETTFGRPLAPSRRNAPFQDAIDQHNYWGVECSAGCGRCCSRYGSWLEAITDVATRLTSGPYLGKTSIDELVTTWVCGRTPTQDCLPRAATAISTVRDIFAELQYPNAVEVSCAAGIAYPFR